MTKDTRSPKDRKALNYHAEGRPGKIEIRATKPTLTSSQLSLAYSPGVAIPCLEIAKREDDVFRYTAKGNLVGVITNGTAVLGLGKIGPLASKPVMEGKGVLFKKFADIDVFDIELDEPDVEGMIRIIKALGPTFGGINLEDIKAPDCFEIEKALVEQMDIPVFHDDQHGTAIIAAAAFINALEVVKKKIHKVKIVFSGAGAASMACAKLFIQMGAKKDNLIMCDSKGVLYEGRTSGMNKYKDEFAAKTEHRSLAEAIKKADAFIGLSVKGLLSKEMVASMGKKPIIFAMANPDPEITPEEVAKVRKDAIMATGRSDYPNQVNNVLGFPFIFRGALDVRAKKINEEMKLAAVKALADLAKEEVPDEVKRAYDNKDFSFGPQYLIPKPFDHRVLTRVAPAVAKAAVSSGVARHPITDFEAYALELEARLGSGQAFIKSLRDRIDITSPPRIAFAEGEDIRILYAVNRIKDESPVCPILIGDPAKIYPKIENHHLYHLHDVEIIHPEKDPRRKDFTHLYYSSRQRKGVSLSHAQQVMGIGNYFGAMLVKNSHVDGMITGAAHTYPESFRPVMEIVGTHQGHKAAGIIILVSKNKLHFIADCTLQFDPDAKALADIAIDTAGAYHSFTGKHPKVAFLSFSNFGSSPHPDAKKMAKAASLTKEMAPYLVCDGELQADVAVDSRLITSLFPFSDLQDSADVLIMPNLNAANIAYKLAGQLSEDIDMIGPIIIPLNSPINIVQRTSTVDQIVHETILTAFMAQRFTHLKKDHAR
ncbi:MAG: NADP-dependent malic enzyme [Bacteriovoracales bacterium]|nr:NADP-dependent malic enzyme [Bacteriovoracales bacterium]